MRLIVALLASLIAAPAVAQDAERFNLVCREFEDPDTLRDVADHEFSVDLQTMTVCRANNVRCWPVVRQGRFLEMTYTYPYRGRTEVVFRLYDPQTGWLTQIMRTEDEPGRNYGDAVCEVTPFASVMD